jgi:3-hydroxyisobutyrate dehydrogenase-like beta-hydroxyacid dehydrogenase/transcriptional regulator with XRE-family HTH domain
VGARIRARRLERGITLRQFARDIDVSASFISQLETGKAQASVATFYTICAALDTSIDELFDCDEPAMPKSGESAAHGAHDTWLSVDDNGEPSATECPPVAVLGMGKMGHALVGLLLEHGWMVRIWNRSPKDVSEFERRGAVRLHSLEDLWDHAGVVITFLANDDALADVTLRDGGILHSGSSDRVLIDMSTVSPRISADVAARAEAVGVRYLRSPVSGNPAVMSEGKVTLLVSGPRDTFERVGELLNSIGSPVLYVGDAEQSRTLKLALNSALAVTTQVMAELIVLGENSGIDRKIVLDALGESVLGSPFVRYKSPGLINHEYSATFTTNHLVKDLEMALDVAHTAKLSLPVIELVNSLTRVAAENGYGEVDLSSLLPSLQLTLGQTPDIEPPT